jgi:hypothetical protein
VARIRNGSKYTFISPLSVQSAKSRAESRRSTAKSKKDEEPLKLPPINGDQNGASAEEEMEVDKEEPKLEELDDYEKLVKAIEGNGYISW